MHHALSLKEGLILRCVDPEFNNRIWKIVRTSWGRWGQIIEVQNAVQEMEQKPSRTKVEYLIKIYTNDQVSYPSIREAVQLLNGNTECDLEIDGVRKPIVEFRKNKNETIEAMKKLAAWCSE